jgi:asparagine synthase (glutamine-hydrolysing)
MVSSVMHRPYQVVKASAATALVACVNHGNFNHSVVACSANDDVGVVLDGWIYTSDQHGMTRLLNKSDVDAAKFCLSAYMDRGISFVETLNGQFNLFIWDDRSKSVYLVNDRYGLRPLQYSVVGETLYFAPEAKGILAADGVPRRLNVRMLINLLSWGRIWIGHDTFFENIFMLPPASILCWQDGKIKLRQYWDYVFAPEARIDAEFLNEAVSLFRQAIARQTAAPLRYGISLSGGLDSRSVLAAACQTDGIELDAYSWGVSEGHDELTIARDVANKLGVPWHFQPLVPSDFIAKASDGVFFTEGLDLMVQSYGLKIYPSIQLQTDTLLNGLALDVMLGGTYLSRSIVDDTVDSESAFSTAMKKAEYLSPSECLRLVRIKEAGGFLDDLRTRAQAIWQASQNSHPADRSDRFFMLCRMWRYIFLRLAGQRLFLEATTPTLDHDFLDLALRIPPSWRVEHRFYQRFLEAMDPRMMQIFYQRTMLPPSAPLEFWNIGASVEGQREQLYRDIWRATNGAVFIPYQRFFSNYDEWLRFDPDWISMTDDLLLSPKSLSCDRFLNRQFIANLIDDHRSGKADKHQQIIQMMTLELFLRRFFS